MKGNGTVILTQNKKDGIFLNADITLFKDIPEAFVNILDNQLITNKFKTPLFLVDYHLFPFKRSSNRSLWSDL